MNSPCSVFIFELQTGLCPRQGRGFETSSQIVDPLDAARQMLLQSVPFRLLVPDAEAAPANLCLQLAFKPLANSYARHFGSGAANISAVFGHFA
ncbi:MAG: hypothetical protein K1X75_04385 [Leptospirales bacterium]|nr:hypothetical protein [Leptospirales bacterium]